MEKTKGTAKKVCNIILNVIIWIFVVFSVAVTALAFAAQSNSARIPSIGGKSILTVQTPSMEPTIMTGDIIIGNKITAEEAKTLKVDDIITYSAGDLNGDGIDDVNTHRIVEVITEGDSVSYITKGDNNYVEDGFRVLPENVLCRYEGTRIAGLGRVLSFLQQPKGFLIVIVLPLILFFLYELFNFIKKFLEIKNSGTKQITAAEEELIKQRAVEEYLRAQKEKEEVQNAEEERTE